jgi:hypothetical protein
MDKIIMYVVGALVICVLAGALLPTALTSLHSANTTGWTSGEVAIFGVIGVIILVGIVIGIVYMALKK